MSRLGINSPPYQADEHKREWCEHHNNIYLCFIHYKLLILVHDFWDNHFSLLKRFSRNKIVDDALALCS
jgi:hypothetical protein